jgi:hypothetical protein
MWIRTRLCAGYAGGSAARKAGQSLSSERARRERVEEEADLWGPFVSEIERGKVGDWLGFQEWPEKTGTTSRVGGRAQGRIQNFL